MPPQHDDDDRAQQCVCPATRLSLVSAPDRLVWRVAKSSFGPLNPLQRSADSGCDVSSWGRWDVRGARTVYAAESPAGAYVETLAWAWAKDEVDVSLDTYFDPEDDDQASFMAQVNEDFRGMGLDQQWGQLAEPDLRGRELYSLQMPAEGWFVDIGTADTIASISQNMPKSIRDAGVTSKLTAEHLYGANRRLTTDVAYWLYCRDLFDGSGPLGIRYRSKFGYDFPCYAIWLDDDEPGSQPKLVESRPILPTDADLDRAASLLQVYVS